MISIFSLKVVVIVEKNETRLRNKITPGSLQGYPFASVYSFIPVSGFKSLVLSPLKSGVRENPKPLRRVSFKLVHYSEL